MADDEVAFNIHDSGHPAEFSDPDSDSSHKRLRQSGMNKDNNFAVVPRKIGENYAAGHQEQQPYNRHQNTKWASSGWPANEHGWNQSQMPQQQEVQCWWIEISQAQALGHPPHQFATSNMRNQQGDYAPTQRLPQSIASHPVQSFQVQPRCSGQRNRPTEHSTASPLFSVPEKFQFIESTRREPQPTHTFTPTAMLNSFRQTTRSHLASLERHYEQLQQDQGNDEQIRKAEETLLAARRAAESSSQTLGLLQPLTGIPFSGTQSRLQSLADQIATAIQSLIPGAAEQSTSPEEGVQLNKKVQDLNKFIEYLEGVHPQAVRRAQASTEPSSTSGNKPRHDSEDRSVSTSPYAPASASSQMGASDDDSCRWVDGQATPTPDYLSAMAHNRDQSRMFRDMANGDSRILQENRITSEFYPNAAYSRPSSLMNSPVMSQPAPAEPNHGFFQQALPVPVQQSIPLSDYAIQSRPSQAYAPLTSAEVMRPMQAVPSLPSQHYTTQQDNPFCLGPSQQTCMYPMSAAELPQSGCATRSPVSSQSTGPNPQAGYYEDTRSSLPDRRPMRQERQAPYSLSCRDQRWHRISK